MNTPEEIFYTVKSGIAITGSNLLLPLDDEDLKKVTDRYGDSHHIEPVWGTSVDLTVLKLNETVCIGDGQTYHFKLTDK